MAEDLAAKVRFLASAVAHDAAGPVTAIETHMSWVFLAGDRAWKLKKPMSTPWLDYSTLARRRQACRDEVRLNRRLAPTVYLGVVPLLRTATGLQVGALAAPLPEGGVVLDWLVVMQRVPDERLLDHALAAGGVTSAHIDAVVRCLAHFYRQARPVALDGQAYLARLHEEQRFNAEVLLSPGLTLPGAAALLERFRCALTAHAPLLRGRADQGCLVDGHGDLRPEHVALLDPPQVIDCLEFSTRLREVDPWDEIAFLALECRIAGAAWVGERLFEAFADAQGAAPPAALWPLYTARRALVRARLAWAHLQEPSPRHPTRWAPLAQHHLDQAASALDGLEQGLNCR